MGKSHVKSLSGSNLTPKSKEKSLLLFYFCANLNTNHCIAVHVFYVTVMYIAIGKWMGIIGTKNGVEKIVKFHNSKEDTINEMYIFKYKDLKSIF